MFKQLIYAASFLILLTCATACSEQDEVSEYANWKERNEQFIDSIAAVAQANADGSWTIIRAFSLSDEVKFNDSSQYYIYVQKLENGTGTQRPQYNDSIRLHYIGRLIASDSYPQGRVFGKSFRGTTLDERTDVPTLMGVNQNVVGMATAEMHMVIGDHWRIYIPAYLGYGSTTYSSANIPAHSALIFEAKLARIYRYQIDTNTDWW
jgi:FKBP-type peptidyl-prolyl cis-trans isomerase FklB